MSRRLLAARGAHAHSRSSATLAWAAIDQKLFSFKEIQKFKKDKALHLAIPYTTLVQVEVQIQVQVPLRRLSPPLLASRALSIGFLYGFLGCL
jgi:hypothetical protein